MSGSENLVQEYIEPYINNREVLDVGFADPDLFKFGRQREWIHDFIKDKARSVVGIDSKEEEVQKFKEKGYDVYTMNAESFEFSRYFDVIFAGELIEHLSNQGLFLDCCKRHLRPGGILILTTPSAYSTKILFQCLRLNTHNPENNPEHTLWHSPTTMEQVLNRHGFSVVDMKFVNAPSGKNWKRAMRLGLEKVRGKDTKERMIVLAKVIGK